MSLATEAERAGPALELAANENALGPSPAALAALARCAGGLHRYPDPESRALRAALAERHGLLPEHFRAGSGSDELIQLLCRSFLRPGDEALCSRYAFYRFREHAEQAGAQVTLVAEPEFRQDLDALAAAVSRRTRMVYLVNPNNPTGSALDAAGLELFLPRMPPRVLVLLDEAYYEYARGGDYPETVPDWVRRFRNLVVLRTFSKAYGLAGLRVGWCAARPELGAALDRLRPTFNVGSAAQEAARAALGDGEFLARAVALARREGPALAAGLERLGFRVLPSAANFLCAEAPAPVPALDAALRARGIRVRPLAGYGLPGHVRISVGLPEENRALLAALGELLGVRP